LGTVGYSLALKKQADYSYETNSRADWILNFKRGSYLVALRVAAKLSPSINSSASCSVPAINVNDTA